MAQTVLDPGLPHGRLWVVERGCECGACERRRTEDRVAAEAAARDRTGEAIKEGRRQAGLDAQPKAWTTRVSFKRATNGEWVVVGPTNKMRVGTMHVIDADGRSTEVYVYRLGRCFDADGVSQRYGYIRR